MVRTFHLLPRGTYFIEGVPREVADFVADYATDGNVVASARGLDLTHEKTRDAVRGLQDNPKNIINEAYVIEGDFQREPMQTAAIKLGFTPNLIAIILGDAREIGKVEVIPFHLSVREEDVV